jgi:hypothetical protein
LWLRIRFLRLCIVHQQLLARLQIVFERLRSLF